MQVLILESGDIQSLELVLWDKNYDEVEIFIEKSGGFWNGDFVTFDDLSPQDQIKYENVGDDYPYIKETVYHWWSTLIQFASNGDDVRVDGIIEALNDAALKLELQKAFGDNEYSDPYRRLQIIKRYLGVIDKNVFTSVHGRKQVGDGNEGLMNVYLAGEFNIDDGFGGVANFSASSCSVCSWFNSAMGAIKTTNEEITCEIALSKSQKTQLQALIAQSASWYFKTRMTDDQSS